MERIDEGNNFHSRAVKSEDRSFAILRLFLPLAQKISKKNAGKIKKDSLDKMSRMLMFAGSPMMISPVELYNMRIAGAVEGLALGLALGWLNDMGIMPAIFCTIAGFVMPVSTVNSLIKKRGVKCNQEIPEVLDLISVCMDSGMTLQKSIETVCGKNEGLLVDELRLVLSDLDRGANLLQAFQGLARRIDSKRLDKILQAVKLHVELGTPIANQFQILSDSIRQETFEEVKQHAAKAALAVLFPVALFVIPALFIIIGGPVVITTMMN